MSLIYRKIQIWCCPGVGHLHPFFKPHCGVFVWTPGPTGWHLQLFQNKMTNARAVFCFVASLKVQLPQQWRFFSGVTVFYFFYLRVYFFHFISHYFFIFIWKKKERNSVTSVISCPRETGDRKPSCETELAGEAEIFPWKPVESLSLRCFL